MVPPFFRTSTICASWVKGGSVRGLRTDHRHYPVWLKLKQTNLDLAHPLLRLVVCRSTSGAQPGLYAAVLPGDAVVRRDQFR
jgi:hypothetical protein